MNFDKKIFPLIVGLVCSISCFYRTLSAADDPIIKSISVRYVGTKTISKERILSQISAKVGEPLSVFRIDEDVRKMYDTGEVSNVRVLSEQAKGGVALIVVVECRALYGGVRFQGNTVYSDKRLGKTIDMPKNRAIDEIAIRRSREEILNLYRKKGYPETKVGYKIGSPDARGLSAVVFSIDEGSQGVLRAVKFLGNKNISAVRLKEVMQQKEKSVQSLISGGGRTDAESIAHDVRAIEDYYRDNGYFDAKVVKVAKVSVDAKYDDLVITIDEGKVYTISAIEINGTSVLSKEKDISPHLKTLIGKPFSGSALRDDIKMIEGQYHSRGHIDARVVPRIDNPDKRSR